MTTIVKNSKGEQIMLTKQEANLARVNQRVMNSLGYNVDITTLTTIIKQISEQKFFEIAPADFIPVVVGEGAWSDFLLTYRSFDLSGDFSEGIINTGTNNSRLAAGDAAVDAVQLKVLNWAKEISWTIPSLQMAAKSGNWDLVTEKEHSRKKNWDLGIQKVAFLGLDGDAQVNGLLSVPGTQNNLTLITKPISSMTPTESKAFIIAVLDAYRTNCNRSAWPTHFTIPESDFLGLAAPSNADFPLKSVLAVLEETFKTMTKNPGFKIQACAYGDPAYNSLGVNRYVLHNYDARSIRMNLPVDYTNTLANSTNNFSFQNAAYGQFTGVQAIRPLELFYMSW